MPTEADLFWDYFTCTICGEFFTALEGHGSTCPTCKEHEE